MINEKATAAVLAALDNGRRLSINELCEQLCYFTTAEVRWAVLGLYSSGEVFWDRDYRLYRP